MENSTHSDYWNGYYQREQAEILPTPSQFAVFIASEIPHTTEIIDVGCGNGRDTLFFLSQRRPAIGFDASDVAIKICLDRAARFNLKPNSFRAGDISSQSELIAGVGSTSNPGLIYARFVLHAITVEAEDMFFEAAARAPKGTYLAAEFRTWRDENLNKNTPSHYRRYIDPLKLIAKAIRLGFDATYFVEGFGYARHGKDDAHVARCIFRRS